jgi:transposase
MVVSLPSCAIDRPYQTRPKSVTQVCRKDTLVPHKRGPKQAHKLTDEVLSFIGEVRQKQPSVRLPDLVKLIQERFGTKVHPRSIERSLLRHQKKTR